MPSAGYASGAVNACRAGGMPCAGYASGAENACRAGGMPCAGYASVVTASNAVAIETLKSFFVLKF